MFDSHQLTHEQLLTVLSPMLAACWEHCDTMNPSQLGGMLACLAKLHVEPSKESWDRICLALDRMHPTHTSRKAELSASAVHLGDKEMGADESQQHQQRDLLGTDGVENAGGLLIRGELPCETGVEQELAGGRGGVTSSGPRNKVRGSLTVNQLRAVLYASWVFSMLSWGACCNGWRVADVDGARLHFLPGSLQVCPFSPM